MPSSVFDAQGSPIRLRERLGSGGEGIVYALAESNRVAKVYHQPPGPEKAAKLRAMVAAAHPDLAGISAWPMGTLHQAPGGRLAGVIMPRVTGYLPVHHLYSPAHRKLDFAGADWAFLILAARNIAGAFGAVHQHGHVVGDVNQDNVVVSQNATTKLIDCDSFQVSSNGHRFLCEVGVAHFTPPELQGRSFNGVVRTLDHDRFGLAVLIFHVLFMGRHPFVGIFHGRGDMPVERAIQQTRFAFGADAAEQQMSPPPHALTLQHVTPQVAALFVRSFGAHGSRGRPGPGEWIEALDRLRQGLRRCSSHPGHKFAAVSTECPWCAIERAGGPDFFVAITIDSRLGEPLNIERVYERLLTVPWPNPVLPVPRSTKARPRPLPGGMAHFRTASILTGVASFVCLVLLFANVAFGAFAVVGAFLTFVLYHGSGITEELAQRRRALAHAVEEHEQSIRLWQAAVVEPAMAIRIAMTEVEELRDRYCDLPRKYQEDKSMLENQGRERQLQHFLAGKIIASAKIPGIGSSLVGTLRSFGIETAADINYHTVRRAPGIGSSRARALVEWRQAVEGRFRFDPKKGVDRSDIDKLDRTYWRQRNEIERGLNERALRIRELSQRAIAQHGTLAETCIQAAHARAQAEADVAV